MSIPANLKFYHPGVIIPTPEFGQDDQWSKNHLTFRNGMVFINGIRVPKVACVQSRGTGEVLINKVYKSGPWPGVMPLELRISTAPAVPYCRLPGPIIVNGVERIIFTELVAWQRIREGGNAVYSLYFRFYNGGSLDQLLEKYFERLIPVPEHFIWLVAERLLQALRFFQFGLPPGSNYDSEDWEFISHRDLFPANIFIHYHSRRPGRLPIAGRETNAFPQIVIGDFGEANMENDGDDIISSGVLADGIVHKWEDMDVKAKLTNILVRYFMGEILRRMVQTHIPYDAGESDLDRPNGRPMSTINNHIAAPYTPYSDELLDMLANFEIPGGENGALITETIEDGDGNDVPLSDYVPEIEWLVETMLPLARRKVRRYRGIRNRPAGYFDALDVSWTRPKRFMPYEYTIPPVVQDDNDDASVNIRDAMARDAIRIYERWDHIDPTFTTFWYRDPAIYDLAAGPPAPPPPPPPPGGRSDVESTPEGNDDSDSD
ncbi:hypothetical protein F4814DRAFT_459363 [Daldinia grandis]|nr:hypothetical protein F4814DRAFT_459363 [Daldinia grandis]